MYISNLRVSDADDIAGIIQDLFDEQLSDTESEYEETIGSLEEELSEAQDENAALLDEIDALENQ